MMRRISTLVVVLALAGLASTAFAHGSHGHASLACDALPGQAHKICKQRVKGEEKVRKAYRKAMREPSPRADYKLAKAEIKADYKLRKQQCKALPGKHARKSCKHTAKDDYKWRKEALGPKPGH